VTSGEHQLLACLYLLTYTICSFSVQAREKEKERRERMRAEGKLLTKAER